MFQHNQENSKGKERTQERFPFRKDKVDENIDKDG